MRKLLSLTIFAAFITIGSAAHADGPFPADMTNGSWGPNGIATPQQSGESLQVYSAVNLLLGSAVYANDAALAPIEYTGNSSSWLQTSDGGYAFIGLGAAATNTLNVYSTSTPNNLINVFGGGFSGQGNFGNGTPSNPFYGTASVIPVNGTFGFQLNENYGSTINNWYSDTTLNSDGMDHMLVYNLSALANTQISIYDPNTLSNQTVTLRDPYLVAVEDTPETNSITGSPSDLDYNDYIFLVDGAEPIGMAPVPEPMTLALFAVGLMGIAVFSLRRKFAFMK